eukprot:2882746-Ditylum_brightwellii.AAC.1
MKNAERHKYLSDDQHGGRNGREAPDIAFRKTITFDTLHLQRANFGYTDCDVKACYNRIIPLVLLLAYFKAGVPCMNRVFLINMLYHLRYPLTTAYGEATTQN